MAGFQNLAASTFSQEIFDNNFAVLELQNTYQHGRGVINGLSISAGAAYTVNVAEGRLNGLISKYFAAFTITMTVSTVRYLWVNEDGATTQTTTDADPGGTYVCLGKGTCDGAGAITVTNEGRMDLLRWTDVRTSKIGDNLIVFSLASGANRVGVGKVPTQGTLDLSGELYGSSNFDFGSGQLKFDATNKRLGVRTNAPSDALDVSAGHARFTHVTAPTAPTAALAGAGAGSVTSGTHSYKVTFVTADGETEGGSVSGTVTTTGGDGKVNLTAIPVSANSAVTSRKIYRTAAGAAATGPWKLLATISDNLTTTYLDNIADGSLGANIPEFGTTAGDVKAGATVAMRVDQGGRLSHTTNQRESVNVETLAGNKTLVLADANYQYLDAGGAGRDVTLPALGNDTKNYGAWYRVQNVGSANDLTLKEPGGTTISVISPGSYYTVYPRPSSGVPIWPTGGPYASTAAVT